MDEKRIETLVSLLRDKSESEIASVFENLSIPPEEQIEIRRRLLQLKPPPRELPPEELRKHSHFRELVPRARRGEVIFFIGAGVSVDAGMPSTRQLWDALRAEAALFGEEISSEFPRAAGEIERIRGRHKLVQILRAEFERALKAEPPPYQKAAYRLLSRLPPEITRIIITTNWDDLLKRAFESAGRSPVEITKDVTLPQVPLADPAILKLHGDFEDPEGMVITEIDYSIVSSKIRERTAGTLYGYVAALLARYSFVFIGYRKADPDFRLLEDFVKMGVGERKHFFVAPLSRVEEEAVSLWANVKVIPATATNFLLALFRELDEFANRQYELDLIFKPPSPPFIEFYGPYGSGKTALLDAAERRAQAKGWTLRQIVRVNWDRKEDGTLREPIDSLPRMLQVLNEALSLPVPLKRLEEVRESLLDKRGVFLIFDGLQNIEIQKELIWFVSDIIAPVIREMNEQRMPSKLLLAGRFPLKDVPYALRREMKSYALSPFSEDDVREMAYNFLLATDPNSQERFGHELIADILEVSGGHALFIKLILEDLLSGKRHKGRIRLPQRLTEEEKRDFTLRFNEELDKNIQWPSDSLKEVYEEVLCVFRRLNRDLLKALELPLEDPLRALEKAYIFSPEGYNDPVIRRIKTARLRFEEPEKFMEAQEHAQNLFAEDMKRLVYPEQLDYLLEWLFHSVQILMLRFPDDPRKRYDELTRMVEKEVIYRAYAERTWGEVGAEVEKRIVEEDKELQTLLEKCVEQDGAAEILKMLRGKEVFDVGQK